MEDRTLLQPNTELRLDPDLDAPGRYVIESVLGVGSLCVLYGAYYRDNLGLKKRVKIKEFNPEQFHLTRNADHSLQVQPAEREYYEQLKERIIQSYVISHQLFYGEHIANFISNAENIFEANGTVYIVYSYMDGQDLAHNRVNTLQEAVRITRSAAETIHRIHQAGYLYLDIKPENILILKGCTDLIQLFDFDSLIPLSETEQISEIRVTFSKGFSPVEQRLGDGAKIGRHSDVYSIGALLFYLLYGAAPRPADCNRRRPYDFTESVFDFDQFPDRLGRELSQILCKTLQSYIGDRYSSMEPLIEALSELEHLADPSEECVLSRIPSCCSRLIGREKEVSVLGKWMADQRPVLFVTGMGGIGKSSAVTAAVQKYARLFDAVSYMRAHGSLWETLADDQNFCLRNMERDPAETGEEYARRKLSHIRKLSRENRILAVIDNYESGLTEDLTALFDLGWKILIVTRTMETGQYPIFPIESISSRKEQEKLFCHYMGQRELTGEDQTLVSRMLELLQGHTLSIELLAKQIRASGLSIPEACALVHRNGISHMGSETILYEKDGTGSWQTVQKILASLYRMSQTSSLQRDLLKLLSLSDIRGVDLQFLAELTRLGSREEINRLIRTGWISRQDPCRIYLHPLIRETVRNVPWEESADQLLTRCLIRIREVLEILSEDNPYTDQGSLCRYLTYARELLPNSLIRERTDRELYENVWCLTAANLQRADEEYVLNCTEQVDTGLICSPRILLKLWDIAVRMLCETGDFALAAEQIHQAGEYLQAVDADDYEWAFYYGNIVSEYYDFLLYDPDLREDQEEVLKSLLEVNQQGILLAFRSEDERAAVLQAEFTADRANFLIRLTRKNQDQILELLSQSEKLLKGSEDQEPEILLSLYLARMWFADLYEKKYEKAAAAWEQARALAEKIAYPDLETIDAILVPGAEMELDFGCFDRSIALLRSGIRLCEEHGDAQPFVRKKQELLEHIEDVITEREDRAEGR